MTPNPGHQPDETHGKRVRVLLANGQAGRADDNPMSPPGWGAEKVRWTLTGHPFDVAAYEVIA